VKPHIHVAVGVIQRDGRVLIARRPDHVHQGGLLEFPGGKVEAGESVGQALVREIAEETGLRVPLCGLEPLIGIRHDYGEKSVFLDVWVTHQAEGMAEGREGQEIQWLKPEALNDADFPVANRPIIRALRLPHRLAITGAGLAPGGRVGGLQASLTGRSFPLIVLRAPELLLRDYQALARECLVLCQSVGTELIVHGAADFLRAVPGAAGVHLPWREAERLSERPVPVDFWLGVSCHSAAQLRHAERLKADYAVLGPVLQTSSHPGEPGIGWSSFGQLVMESSIPVFALGGLGADHEAIARHHGAQGVAGISCWWRNP